MKLKNESRIQAFLLFAFFFFVITAFWTMKPLRTSGVVKALGPDLYPLVKQGSLLLIPLVMVFYEAMTARMSRGGLVSLFAVLFTIGNLAFRLAYEFLPGTTTKIAFFYYVDVYITVMVTLFWTYLNSTFTADEAKKNYGLIGCGGILGGIFGSSIAGWASELLGSNIILVSGVFLVGVFFIVRLLEKDRPRSAVAPPVRKSDTGFWSSSTEGVRLVWKSPYLIAIVGMVGLYEIVSSIVDYQFNASSAAAFASETALAGFQGKVSSVGQILSLLVMALLTPVVFKRFGMLVGLLLLPAALFTGSVAFLLVPILATATATMGADFAFSYSINQASKEILYVPLDDKTKFKAKAFIDMFVFRFAKAIGGFITLGYLTWARPLGIENRWLMLINAGLIALWILAIRRAAKDFAKATLNASAGTKLAA